MTGDTFPGGYEVACEFDSNLGEVRLLQDQLEATFRAAGYTEGDRFATQLAVEEALVNVIRHDNQLDPDKKVRVGYTITPGRFDILVAGEGSGFYRLTGPTPPTPGRGCPDDR